MSFVACLSIAIDASQLEQLNKTIRNFAEKNKGEVMGSGYDLMSGQRDYSVEFNSQQDADAFEELIKKESSFKLAFFDIAESESK